MCLLYTFAAKTTSCIFLLFFFLEKVSYTCEGPVDVAFLLDSSASMFYDYQLQSEFVGKLAKQFNVSPAGTHATILIYSHTAQMKGTLKDGANMTGLTKALANLPFLGGDTRFDRGLYLSRLALFDPKFGARSKVPKVLFVVTDGEQSSFVTGSSPVDLAEELHELGVHVIVLAVGGAVNKKEVQTMASTDDSVFFVKNFIELSSEETIKKLWNHSCSNLRKYNSPHSLITFPFPFALLLLRSPPSSLLLSPPSLLFFSPPSLPSFSLLLLSPPSLSSFSFLFLSSFMFVFPLLNFLLLFLLPTLLSFLPLLLLFPTSS